MAKIHNPQNQEGINLVNEEIFNEEKTRIEGILGITEKGEKSLNEMISDNSVSIESNYKLITDNTAAIAGNTTTINEHTAAINANATAIGEHTATIDAIKTAIGTVPTDKNLAGMIKSNSDLIVNNTAAIDGHTAAIADNTVAIANNAAAIGGIKTTIGTVPTDKNLVEMISNNTASIESNTKLIANNTTSIESNTTSINEIKADIGTVEGGKTLVELIANNSTAIDSLSSTIGNVESGKNIVDMIGDNTSSINDIKDSTDTNATAIADLQTKDTALEGLIDANATAITELQAKDDALQASVTANATANTALTEKLDAFIKEAPIHAQSIQSDGGESISVRGIGEEIKEGGRLKSLTVYCPSANNTTETIWLKVFKMHESGSGEHTFIGISDEALQHGQNKVLNYTFNNSDIILEKGTTYFFTFAAEAQKDSIQFQSPATDSVDCCIKVIARTNQTAGILGSNTWSDRSKMPLYNIEFYSSLAKVDADAKAAVEDLDARVNNEFNFTKNIGNWHLLGGNRTNVASARRVKLVPTESGFIKSFSIKCRSEGNRVEPTTVATYLTVEDENGNEIARSLEALNHGLENSSGKILKFEFNSNSKINKGADYYFVFRREDNDQEINACFVTTLTGRGGATEEELFGGILQGSATITAQMIFDMELSTAIGKVKSDIEEVEDKISTTIDEVKSNIETIETSVNDITANIAVLKPYKFNVVDGLPVVKADFSDTIVEDVFTLDDNGVATYVIPADIYKVDIISSEKTETFVIGEDKPADHVLYTVNDNTLTAANSENTLSIKTYKAAADIQNIEVELILNDRAGKVITANAVSLVENVMCSADMLPHGVKISAYINKPESNIDSHIILDSICDSNTYDNSQHVCQVLRLEITI